MAHVNIIERKAMEKCIEQGDNYKAEKVTIKMLKDGEDIEKIAYYSEL